MRISPRLSAVAPKGMRLREKLTKLSRRLMTVGVVGIVLTLAGCDTVSRAGRTVADTSRNVVDTIKRKTAGVPSTNDVAPSSDDFELTGVLSVIRYDDCSVAEGCGPEYRLFSENFTIRTALTGDIHEVHDQLLVTLRGQWIPITNGPLKGDTWRRKDSAVRVSEYDVLTGIRYRDFLLKKARDYSTERYGCDSSWDRSFGWRIVNREPYLIVSLTNAFSNQTPRPSVSLWYHGNTGKFLRESKSHANVDPCK